MTLAPQRCWLRRSQAPCISVLFFMIISLQLAWNIVHLRSFSVDQRVNLLGETSNRDTIDVSDSCERFLAVSMFRPSQQSVFETSRELTYCRLSSKPRNIIQDLQLSVLVSVGPHYRSFLKSFLEDVQLQTLNEAYYEVLFAVSAYTAITFGPEDVTMLLQYAHKFPNTKITITNDDLKLYNTWNFLLKNIARGVYVCNANLDDHRHPDSWRLKVQHLQSDPHLGVVSSTVLPFGAGNSVRHSGDNGWFWSLAKESVLQTHHFFKKDKRGKITSHNFPHNSPMWRKSIHSLVGYFDPAWDPFSDFEFWLRCNAAGIIFHLLQPPLEYYYINPSSYMRKEDLSGAFQQENALELYRMYSKGEEACIPKRVLFIHEKFLPSQLEGGDHRVLSLFKRIASTTCSPPLFVARESMKGPELRNVKMLFQDMGAEFLATDNDLSGLNNLLCTATKFQFDISFMSLWFWREGLTIPEQVNRFRYNAPSCMGKRIVITDDIHWLHFAQGSSLVTSGLIEAKMLPPVDVLETRERELLVWQKADLVVTTTQTDEALLHLQAKEVQQSVQTCVVPHVQTSRTERANAPRPRKGSVCVFGSGSWHNAAPVLWFLKTIYCKIGSEKISLSFFGSRWDYLNLQQDTPCHLRVLDLKEEECWVALSLSFIAFSGIRMKAFHALQQSIPVVATPFGLKGTGGDFGKCGVLVGTSSTEIAQAIEDLLHDPFYTKTRASVSTCANRSSSLLTLNLPGCLVKALIS